METIIKDNGQNLSGGQIQKLAILRCLYRDPSLVVLDEPTTSLDQSAIIALLNTLKELKGKKTIIIVSHEKKILKFCDDIYSVKKRNLKKISYRTLK